MPQLLHGERRPHKAKKFIPPCELVVRQSD